jgi:Cof subfamily protein (haloacid dehalogenase superfamily)
MQLIFVTLITRRLDQKARLMYKWKQETRGFMTHYVICVDMDGTLLNKEGAIHPSDREILAHPGEIPIIPATGRPLHSIRRALARNGLWTDSPIPLPMTLDNGCALYIPVEKRIQQVSLPTEVQQALLEIIPEHPKLSFAFNHQDEVHVPWQPTPLASAYFERFDFNVQLLPENGTRERYSKLSMVSDDHAAIQRFSEAVRHLEIEQVSSMPNMCEMFPRGRHKARGVSELLDHMGLSDAFILAAGDGGNDLELFDLAGRTFAPNTSPPHILERADEILDAEKTGILAPMLEWARRSL